ncbi:molybdenum cofactor guanylyltransferase [uncultured Sphingomonas sp.]|uniref:molybdenum cofactor guanylyltransferase n=1 Tax=uncultured Sphingomonas sp. TaxID=158754 RepID=UPI0035CC484E
MSPRILGALIAGGAASRFGSDKALAPWRGRVMIGWAADALAPWCGRVVVVGRAWGGLPSVADLPSPGLGPLGGIAGALAHAGAERFDAVMTIACDMPDVPGALIGRLLAAGGSVFCADAPILGVWPVTLGPALVERLAGATPGAKDGRLSIRRWALDIGATPVPAPGPLANVNTPADLVA